MDRINSRITITLDDKKTSVETIIGEIRKCGFRITERIDSVGIETSEKAKEVPLNQ
jgi:hypothetical protein